MRHPSGFPQRAIALVLVLAFLVLLSGLIIAYFSSVQVESASSQSYKESVTVRQLNATATGIVTGQIMDATHSQKAPGQSSERIAWASQPGMIRTWDDSGKGWRIFKLYSAQDMVANYRADGTYSVEDARASEIPNDWPTQTAIFVDLNRPEVVADSKGQINRDGRKYRASYPILDPIAAVDIDNTAQGRKIDGFKIDPLPPGYGGPSTLSPGMDPTRPSNPDLSGNPAAMPVRWIYVLKDGTLTVPTGTEDRGATATWTGADSGFTPSKDNPITGRIAFWTDDESCKLNINTASEPTPWDTPRAVTIKDLQYGQFQPAMREFQRYPGHPYMTALSPVFFPGVALTPDKKESIYKLLPRVREFDDGRLSSATRAGTTKAGTIAASFPVSVDADRLFATVDELLFLPAYGSNGRTEDTLFDSNRLRRARFFLTANSRAPELNLFGQPRISLWPENVTTRTAYDRLAAFCSTIGTGSAAKPYYFQRQSSDSPTADYNNISRNQDLFKYLQNLTDQRVPGYGGTFAKKWGTDRDQVLTEIFDYIRCVNLHDTTSGALKFANNGQVTPIQIRSSSDPTSGVTQGFGRYHTISQFGFHFICSQDGAKGAYQALPANQRYIEAAFLFTPYSPSLGFYTISENLSYDVTFLTPLTISNGSTSQDLKFPTTTQKLTLSGKIGAGWHNNGREHGGAGGLRGPLQGFGGGGYPLVSKPKSVKLDVSGSKTMHFSGGTIEVKVYVAGSPIQTFKLNFPGGDFPVPDLVTTGTDDYRPGSITTDASYWWTFASRYSNAGVTPHAPGAEYALASRRWADSGGPPGFKKGGLFRREDVVRTIVPDHGDLRLVAAQKDAGSDFVMVRPNEWNSNYRFLHIFESPAGSHLLYGFANEPGPGSPSTNPLDIPMSAADDQLIPNPEVQYHYARLPEIRPGAGKIYNRWGDFDNGMSTWPDGAYINKPDEGNQAATNSPYNYFAWNFTEGNETFFSPSRLVPSAGMLGSLPTGVKRNAAGSKHAWETLLFRPETRKDENGKPHPGTITPKDHLIMDLFWMPVIEPYAISEPFSTAGKINLNYEIAPFNYIRRTTALHGLMKSEEPLLLANKGSKSYKLWDHETNDHPRLPNNALDTDGQVRTDWGKLYAGQAPFDKLRRPIDVETTLKQADDRFKAGEIFRSGTEICELHLVRQGENLSDYVSGSIWRDAAETGDNTRERPYTNLYARLTTRSNVYTIHTCVQVLKQPRGAEPADWARWSEKTGQMESEYRGSTIVERYIDPADPNLIDFAKASQSGIPVSADQAYKFRTVSTKKFTP